MATDEGSYLKLHDVLDVLRRRKMMIALSVVVAVGVAVAGSLLLPATYAATAELLVTRATTRSLFDPGPVPAVEPGGAAKTELPILKSQPVRNAVRTSLGAAPKITATAVNGTDVIRLRAQSSVPSRAAEVANAYANAYLDFRQQRDEEELSRSSQDIQSRINDLQPRIDQAAAAQRDALVQAQAYFRQQLDQLQVDAARTAQGARLLDRAAVPTVDLAPSPWRTGVWALAVGLLVGVGLAIVVECLDDSVKTKADLEKVLPGLPVLGVIPATHTRSATAVVSLLEPRSPAAEAYRTLRTAMLFLALKGPLRTVHVTSPGPQEGKTTILANLGVALARAGQRVVIVCCDLRRPRIHEMFGLTNDVGLTSVLLGQASLAGALQTVPEQGRLFVLASGPLPPDPSEVLLTARASSILHTLHEKADVVLLDSPPVLPVTDALVLAGFADATLVACAAGRTKGKEMLRALELLRQVSAPPIGLVLFGATAEDAYGYYAGDYASLPGREPHEAAEKRKLG